MPPLENEKMKTRRRSRKAVQTDKSVAAICKKMVATSEIISARSVARKLEVAPSSITRDKIRSKIIFDAKKLQISLRDTTERQLKSSRSKDAETIARQLSQIESLRRENQILLASHKALYNVIREIGGAQHWERFFNTALEVQQEIIDAGGLDKP